ncbi:hypothetical protein EC973_008955 [Apophysomyces ossiformis]|uniref:Uncharacterized protein n=1 Tax=Apophysomyces ossiformis TaxID=679940 RepID=A0A8H7BM96_9FUNG|nr:hypothetical protein EC973_008955 [Apophysomyces ossiformis]
MSLFDAVDNLTTAEQDPANHRKPQRMHTCRNPISIPERITSFYRRYHLPSTDSYDSYSYYTSTSSRQSTAMEIIFSRLLDAIIFTSALAITAYNYWTGSLDPPAPPPPTRPALIKQWKKQQQRKSVVIQEPEALEDSRRQRTQQWAETIVTSNQKLVQRQRPSSPPVMATASRRADAPKRDKRRTQSLPNNPAAVQILMEKQKEDEMFARMQERLQSLIQQGQAALTSTAIEVYERDEIAVRTAFSAKKKNSV